MDNTTDKYIGRILDERYEILELIGSGGMSMVYKALCHRLNRYDAVKILREDTDEETRERFQAESQAIAMLSHPNIVSVYDVGHLDDIEYIVMELIDGITLKQYLQKKGAIGWREALHFSTQIAKALSHAHERGIVHRDIKPQNIMLLKDGTIKVADFGIAELQNSLSGSSDQAVGSVHYIAPEQARGAVADARSDIYSLGVVMYEMLTGKLPYTGQSVEEIAVMHINGNPEPPRSIDPNIPESLESIVLKAMCADLTDRCQTARELSEELEEFRRQQAAAEVQRQMGPAAGEGELSEDEQLREKYKKRKKRSRKVTILSGVFGVMLFIIAVFVFLWQYWLSDIFAAGERIEIQDFTGMMYEQLINDAQYTDIYNFTVEIQIDQEHEYGTVISQLPEAGKSLSRVSEGINIKLTVSSGYTQMAVPEIDEGSNVSDARTAIESAGFVVEIESTPSDTVTEGMVIGTSPAAGQMLDVGSTVYIMVSSGSDIQMATVPNLVGRTPSDAQSRLESAGLAIGSISYAEKDYEDESMYGLVIWQSVDPNTQVEEGTRVYIQVSSRPAATPTPSPTPTPNAQ